MNRLELPGSVLIVGVQSACRILFSYAVKQTSRGTRTFLALSAAAGRFRPAGDNHRAEGDGREIGEEQEKGAEAGVGNGGLTGCRKSSKGGPMSSRWPRRPRRHLNR